jgi:hypothetical protein
LKTDTPGNPTLNDEEAIDKSVEGLSKALQDAGHSPFYPLVFRMKCA